MKLKYLFFILTFSSFSSILFGQTIKGKIFDGTRNEVISFASILLLDSNSTKTKVVADENGRFKFSKIPPGIYSIKVCYIGYKDTIFQKIKVIKDTILELDIHRFCQYDISIKNKTCPICLSKDNAIPIIYGLLISNNGAPLKNEGKTFKAGGCNISNCDPNWYCKQDNIKY